MPESIPPTFESGSAVERFVARHLNSAGELGAFARQLRAAAKQGPAAVAVAHSKMWTSPTYQRAYWEEVRHGPVEVSENQDARVACESTVQIAQTMAPSNADRPSPQRTAKDQSDVSEAIQRFNRVLAEAPARGLNARREGHVRDDESLPEPDWEMWQQMGEIRLWQAVALLVRLNPDSVVPRISGEFEGASADFYKLRRILYSKLGDLEVASLSLSSPDFSGVKLTVFLNWAEAKGQRVPSELRPLIEASNARPATTSPLIGAPEPEVRQKELYFVGWNEISSAIEAKGYRLGRGDNRRRNAVRLLRRYSIAWERQSGGEWSSVQDGSSAKGGPVRLKQALLALLPAAPTADPA